METRTRKEGRNRFIFSHALRRSVPVKLRDLSHPRYPDPLRDQSLRLLYIDRANSGGGIEARPGTEKRCSHNLQSGPVKTWTAVFVII